MLTTKQAPSANKLSNVDAESRIVPIPVKSLQPYI